MSKPPQPSPLRVRALILTSIVCGSVAAALFWRNSHQQAQLSVTAEQARQFGSASPAEMQAFLGGAHKLGTDGSTLDGWDTADYAFLQKTLSDGSEKERIRVIMNASQLRTSKQFQQVIQCLAGRTIPKDEELAWLSTFQQWTQKQDGKLLASILLSSNNPDLIRLAKEMSNAKQQNTPQR